MKEPIRPEQGPTPRGPYSPGILTSGRLLFVAGQLPIDPASDELVAGDIESQTRQALVNLRGVVEAAGAGPGDVVKVNVFLRDIADAPRVNEVYAEAFTEPYPARTTTESRLGDSGMRYRSKLSSTSVPIRSRLLRSLRASIDPASAALSSLRRAKPGQPLPAAEHRNASQAERRV
jgi:2-iminobutanoate/2-iminopropanoate deaminase